MFLTPSSNIKLNSNILLTYCPTNLKTLTLSPLSWVQNSRWIYINEKWGWVNLFKKENSWQKSFFRKCCKAPESCKKLFYICCWFKSWYITTKNERPDSCIKKYLQNLKYNVKQVYIFNLILAGIRFSLILILPIKRTGDGAGESYSTYKIC